MQIRKILGLLLFLTAGTLSAIHEVHKRGDYVTPHVKWLNPCPQNMKKPRILFFANYWGGGVR